MLSESKNFGGTQEQDTSNLDDLTWFDALSQEEMITMLSDSGPGPVQLPDMHPSVDHSIPGSSNEISTTARRRLQLRFSTAIYSPVLTGKKIKGEGSETIKLVLIDTHTGKQVFSGPEAFAEVEIVVLKEAFASVRSDDWTINEFDQNIVSVWKCKKSLLAESKKLKPKLKLEQGCANLDDVSFTHDRNWLGKTKFRLGARIVDDLNRARVREAKTEPFVLKDCRLESNSKHRYPSLHDHVWRLMKIAKDGKRHISLREANINTVKDFLILRFLNPQKLCEKYGGGGKNWDDTVRHALQCPDKMVCYPSSSRKQTGVVVNASAEVLGLFSEGKFIDELSNVDKANAQKSVISAFECQENVDCFDFPSGHDFGTKEVIDRRYYDQMQPSSSTQDFYSPRESNTEEVSNTLIMDDEPLFEMRSSYDYAIFHERDGSQSHNYANQLNCDNESISVEAGAGPLSTPQKRWKIFAKVWSGAWYFIKKKAAASFHAKKKMRLC